MHRAEFNRIYAIVCIMLLAVAQLGSSHGEPVDPGRDRLGHVRFVPMTTNSSVPGTVFGVEMLQAPSGSSIDGVAQLGGAWLRRNGLLWKDVESIEGRGYKWTAPNVVALERELVAAAERGLQTILVVRGSPRWATQPHTADCAPVNPEKYGRFASFLSEAVTRYSRPPYNVRYWELGNEPDAPIGADNMFGCWGVVSDTYYGGRAYGAMLKTVYPAIKAANPDVKIVNGSLLLDRPDSKSARFFEGVLVAGAGASFDVLGFHSFCMFDSKDPNGHDALYKSCAEDWKVPFLRKLTAEFDIAEKPMLRTETALLCSTPHDACRQQQADFVGRHFARTARDGLLGASWYAFDSDSFRNSSLVEPGDTQIVRPAYLAMKHAATMFGGAQYVAPLNGQAAGVEGYRFRRITETITIVWSNNEVPARVPVPIDSAVTCSSRDGEPFACRNTEGTVTILAGPSPVYVYSH